MTLITIVLYIGGLGVWVIKCLYMVQGDRVWEFKMALDLSHRL